MKNPQMAWCLVCAGTAGVGVPPDVEPRFGLGAGLALRSAPGGEGSSSGDEGLGSSSAGCVALTGRRTLLQCRERPGRRAGEQNPPGHE